MPTVKTESGTAGGAGTPRRRFSAVLLVFLLICSLIASLSSAAVYFSCVFLRTDGSAVRIVWSVFCLFMTLSAYSFTVAGLLVNRFAARLFGAWQDLISAGTVVLGAVSLLIRMIPAVSGNAAAFTLLTVILVILPPIPALTGIADLIKKQRSRATREGAPARRKGK